MPEILISPQEMESTFLTILLQEGFAEEKARLCAKVFTENSVDGVYTHGVNRFKVFVDVCCTSGVARVVAILHNAARASRFRPGLSKLQVEQPTRRRLPEIILRPVRDRWSGDVLFSDVEAAGRIRQRAELGCDSGACEGQPCRLEFQHCARRR